MAKKGTTKTSKTETDPRAQRVQDWLYNNAKGAGYEAYTGDRVANPDAGTMGQLHDQYQKGMGGFDQGFDLLSGMIGQQPDAAGFYNPFQQEVIDKANVGYDSAQDQAFNKINQNAAAQGGFRNARLDLANGTAAGDIANQRGQFMANTQYKGYMDAMDRARQQQQDQIGLGQGMVNLGMGSAASQQGLMDYSRGIDQQGLDAQYQEFMRRQQQPYMQAGLMGGALQGPFGGTQTDTQKKGWLDNIVGMGSQIAGALIPGGGGGGGGGEGMGGMGSMAPGGQQGALGYNPTDYMPQAQFGQWGAPGQVLNQNYQFGSAAPRQ